VNALTSRPAHRARRSMMLATLALPLAIFAVPAVAVAAPVSSALTLTASPAVVDWGRNAVIAVHLAVPPGSSVSVGNRVVHIQFSPTSGPAGFTTIPSVGDVTTNASGNATLAYSPAVNLWYRAVFDGTDDLAPATSNSARVLVRERVTITPNNAGKVKTVRKAAIVEFKTRVQPTFDNLMRPQVHWEIWGTRKNTFQRLVTAVSDPNALGLASLIVHFNQLGRYGVRSRAAGTSANVTSAWTAFQYYNVVK
jgi:hypothetical protein